MEAFMRQIAVDTETFSLIWGARQPGEENENEIIFRVFSRKPSEETPMNTVHESPVFKPALQERRGPEASLRNAYWWQIVSHALERLGKPSSLSAIYKEVISTCKNCDRRMPTEIEATVRGTLEDNSSDSERYKKVRDVFYMPEGPGAGVWGLRIWQTRRG
jgi:hypothetical protein